jgi:hypothetical protein
MSQSVDKFIRQILNKHARDGLEAISTQSNQVHSDVIAVTIVLPYFGSDEHPLYEYGLALRDSIGNKGSIRGRHSSCTDVEWLRGNLAFLQRFIDTLKNEQSVVELMIEKLDTPQ